MTSLYLWWKSDSKLRVFNTTIPKDKKVFDHFVSKSEGYEQDEYKTNKAVDIKEILFISGVPYFVLQSGERIAARTIHAQGKSKQYIKNFYKCQNGNIWYILSEIWYKLASPYRKLKHKR